MTNREDNISCEAPDEELLLAYIRGKTSKEDAQKIEYWLQNDEANERVLLQIASIFYARQRQYRIEKRNPLQAFESARRQIQQRTRRLWIRRISTAAACIAGVIILSTVFSRLHKYPDASQQVQMVTIQANAGMRSQFTLPDGTLVYLNSGSKLSYPMPFDQAQRKVTLVGEGYFDVSHDPDRPFIAGVFNDRLQVKVLGTEFNLYAFDDDSNIAVTLVSGHVDVIAKDDNNKTYAGSLSPSEKATYDIHTGKISIEKVNTQYDTGWIEGKLMFRNSLLPDVLKRLSYFYNVKFDIKNEAINSYRFTGTFDNKQLFQVLDYLQISSNIEYRIKQVTEDDSLGVKQTVITLQ